MNSWLAFFLGMVVVLLIFAAAIAIIRSPWRTIFGGFLWIIGLAYVRVFHRFRTEGRENLPHQRSPGPLIIVANHTAGIDPILIQAACPFPIRWVMAEDMRLPWLNWLWKRLGIIFVARGKAEVAGVREAIRHVKEGGVLGIFPEGGIERPPSHVMPFHPGAGFILRRTKAPVLPVLIDNTPQVEPAWASLWKPSRPRLRFKPVLNPALNGHSPEEIMHELRGQFMEWTGWPASEHRELEPAAPSLPEDAPPAGEPPIDPSRN
ncbi:MAG: lysophospholipid acyltransferase family protein [Phycisphaerales bacterium JB037]